MRLPHRGLGCSGVVWMVLAYVHTCNYICTHMYTHIILCYVHFMTLYIYTYCVHIHMFIHTCVFLRMCIHIVYRCYVYCIYIYTYIRMFGCPIWPLKKMPLSVTHLCCRSACTWCGVAMIAESALFGVNEGVQWFRVHV